VLKCTRPLSQISKSWKQDGFYTTEPVLSVLTDYASNIKVSVMQQEHKFRKGLIIKICMKSKKIKHNVPVYRNILNTYYCVTWNYFLKLEVIMAMTMKMTVFLYLAPCRLVEMYWRFRGSCHLHHQFLFFSCLFHYHISPRIMQQNISKSQTVSLA
jgi:hypothetical protein